jgi:hypothetical protein
MKRNFTNSFPSPLAGEGRGEGEEKNIMKIRLPCTFILFLLLSGCAATAKETATTKTLSDYAVTETITYDQDGKIHSVKRSYVPKPSFSSKVVENIIKSMLPLTDEAAGVIAPTVVK